MKTVAIIPARGGSKGIPRKNLVSLGGIPLIAWSIRVAQATAGIDRVFVSTEDEEIAETARRFGAETPFHRPAELAGDRAGLGPVIEHALKTLKEEGFDFQAYVILYPTQPFRTPAMLEEAIKRLEHECFGFAYLRRHTLNLAQWFGKRDGRLTALADNEAEAKRTVFTDSGCLLGRAFFPEGYLLPDGKPNDEVVRKALLEGDRRFLVGAKYRVIDDPVTLIDIDSEEDLEEARTALQLGKVRWLPPEVSEGASNKDQSFSTKSAQLPISEQNDNQGNFLISPVDSGSLHLSEAERFSLPLMLDPAELRRKVDSDFPYRGKAVVIYRDELPPRDLALPQASPALLLDSTSAFPVRGLRLFERKTFAYFPLQAGAEASVAGLDAGLRCNFRCSIASLHLPESAAVGDRIRLRIFGKKPWPLYGSGFYKFTGQSWQRTGDDPIRVALSPIEVQGDQNCLEFVRNDEMMFGLLIWSREAPGDVIWADDSEPLVFPGWTDYDPESYTWINCMTGQKITGRQYLPEIYRWSGLAYLPPMVPEGSRWETWETREAVVTEPAKGLV